MLQTKSIHAFEDKLCETHLLRNIRRYTDREREYPLYSLHDFFGTPKPFPMAPVSINLDLTLQCNYRCVHCIDSAITHRHDSLTYDEIKKSLITLQQGGLRSVILIGGGEPTLHPDFVKVVYTIKALGLQCAIVSNGSMNKRIEKAAPMLQKGDWVRLSLDAGTDRTFRKLHKPASILSLQRICREASNIKQANPAIQLGFSFVVITPQAVTANQNLTENYREICKATQLAETNSFDYLSLKPFLVRDGCDRETIPPDRTNSEEKKLIRETLLEELRNARTFNRSGFHVVESKNLLNLFLVDSKQARIQPNRCYMQALRQVLSPLGIFSCPAFRGNKKSFIAPRDGYISAESFINTIQLAYKKVMQFDASIECAGITCIYNSTNRWLNELAEHPNSTQMQHSQNDMLDMFL